MFEGLNLFGTAIMGFMNFRNLFDALWATQLGIIIGMLPGLTATMGVALLTTLTFKHGGEQRHPHPDLHVHRRDLRRKPERDPAQHPGHTGERGHDPGRLPLGPAGSGRQGYRQSPRPGPFSVR